MRALVVGYGVMGKRHAETMRNLGYLVTTVDPRPDSGARWTRVPQGVFYDAGIVAVPIRHLAEVATNVDRVCQRLLIEKPGASSAAEMQQLRDAIGASRPAVGYTERWNPVVRALVGSIPADEREGVCLRFTRWNTRRSPNIGLDLTSHDIDLALWLGVGSATFDSRDDADTMQRRIRLEVPGQPTRTFDLMRHGQKPLYAQWHHFMVSRGSLCDLKHAQRVLDRVEEDAPALTLAEALR